jgi:hypothetical protein
MSSVFGVFLVVCLVVFLFSVLGVLVLGGVLLGVLLVLEGVLVVLGVLGVLGVPPPR